MDVRIIPLDRINPAPYNPRRDLSPGEPEYERIKRSVQEFGLVEPLVWNERTGTLVGGHQRMKVLRDLGVVEVEVSVVNLDLDSEKALNIALNRLSGGWDNDLLRTLLEPMSMDTRDLVGFSEADFWSVVAGAPHAGKTEPNDAPPRRTTKIKPGHLYALGPHRILCGDATKSESYARLLGDARADMVFTDPPYGVAIASRVGMSSRSSTAARAEGGAGILNDALDVEALTTFLRIAFDCIIASTSPGAAWYVCAPSILPVCTAFMSPLLALDVGRHGLVWVKSSQVMGRQDYHYRHENIFYGWTPGAARHAVKDRTFDSVWEFDRPSRSAEHPTMKPVELIQQAIENSSDPGALVLDPFVGSGSTIIAAEQSGRRCFAMELDPVYVQVALDRWEAFTGGKATRVTA